MSQSQTLLLVVVIFILLFMLFSDKIKAVLDCVGSTSKEHLSGPTDTSQTQAIVQQSTPQETVTQPQKPVESYAGEVLYGSCNHWLQDGLRSNMSGLVTRSDGVNSALQMDEADPKLKKYNQSYADIIKSEIGPDNIASQKEYCTYIRNDSNIRYIDRDISTFHTPWQGLSLSRQSTPNVVVTNSTQNVGLESSEIDANNGSTLRRFFTK